MCMPLGPKWSGMPGRTAFKTIEDARDYPLEEAREKYRNDNIAMQVLMLYTEEHKEHTLNWMVNDLYFRDWQLLRIAIEDENLPVWKRELRKLKAG